jgi:8-oxo-dGTP pyrophosphatase MutT (NUDIX family)
MAVYTPDPREVAAEAAEDAAAQKARGQGRAGPALSGPVPRPKDAATLILVRQGATSTGGPRILMGQRGRGHSFMPDKYVFPGGKVDRSDGGAGLSRTVAAGLPAETAARLRDGGTRRAPEAFALAAIRETWEEAGLLVGRTGSPARYRGADPGWASYLAAGARPDLSGLTFVGRAITPPYRHKRFDARFFLADAAQVLLDDRPPQDGAEMGDLRWFTFEEAFGLDLPSVTRFILGEVRERLDRPGHEPGVPFLRWTRAGHRMDRL